MKSCDYAGKTQVNNRISGSMLQCEARKLGFSPASSQDFVKIKVNFFNTNQLSVRKVVHT